MLSTIEQANRQHQLLEHGRLKEPVVTRLKIEQDIAFLSDRIDAMKHQSKPHVQLIAYYEGMLRSREAVLKWWLDGSNTEGNLTDNLTAHG